MVNNYELLKFIFNDDSKTIKNTKFSWQFLKQIIKADTKKFKLDVDDENDLYVWKNGTWSNGQWINGIWHKGKWQDGIWEYGEWMNGKWKNGTWNNGTWYDGRWYNGIWHNGIWQDGIWKEGMWYDGFWKNGTWVKGKIYNPKTKQYESSNVPPNKCKWSSSYGK